MRGNHRFFLLLFMIWILSGGIGAAASPANQETVQQNHWTQTGAVPQKRELIKERGGVSETVGGIIGTLVLIGGVLLYSFTDENILDKPKEIFRKTRRNETIASKFEALDQANVARPIVKDSEFSPERFAQEAKELFLKMMGALRNGRLSEAQAFTTETFRKELEKKLRNNKRSNQTEVWERVMVNRSIITDYQELYQSETMHVTLQVLMVHYVKKDETVIRGNARRLTTAQLLLEFVHIANIKPTETQEINCPHCGAPIKVERRAQCPFCKSVVTSVPDMERVWKLNNCEGELFL